MNDREMLSGRAQALALFSLAAVLVGGAPPLRAQDEYRPAHNEIYLELAGNTIFGLNYGRTLSRSVSLRIGAGLVPEVGVTALLMPTLQLGRNSRHGAEAGLGVQGVWAEGGSFAPAMAGTLGYRYRSSGGFLFRAVWSPTWFNDRIHGSAGVSLGVIF
jgi:hypothetical protein